MNSDEKEQFIREILRTMERDILERVHLMPENWNGVQLREYILDEAKKYSFCTPAQRRSYNKDIKSIGGL